MIHQVLPPGKSHLLIPWHSSRFVIMSLWPTTTVHADARGSVRL
jgi:hypothetical protein